MSAIRNMTRPVWKAAKKYWCLYSSPTPLGVGRVVKPIGVPINLSTPPPKHAFGCRHRTIDILSTSSLGSLGRVYITTMPSHRQSTGFIPLEYIPEDPSSPILPNHKTAAWGKCGRSSLAKRCLFAWRCPHIRCNSRPWSRGALYCRAVRRPFWGLVTIL